MLKYVDVHSPNAGGRIEYSEAFDIKELLKEHFVSLEPEVFYHYDDSVKSFGIFNRVFFPKITPQFSLVLKKKNLSKKIKILFVFVHLGYGGAEMGLLTTLKNIERERYECVVVSIEKPGAIGREIEHLGYRVIYLNSKTRLFNLSLIWKIRAIIKTEKPNILHTSLFYANFFGRMASLFMRPALIITEERSMYTEKRFYHIILDKLLSGATDKIIACSKSVIDFTSAQEGIPESKFSLIYNSVDAARFNVPEEKNELRRSMGFKDDDFIAGSVGSLIPKKGHRILIEILPELVKAIPSFRLVIAGDGPEKKALSELAEKKGHKDRVLFLGARMDIPQLMKIMDIFILPSFQEGFPRTIVEAMYMSLPVIASNISGIPEIISHGEDGFLVTAGDSRAIKEITEMLYKDPALRQRLGKNAAAKISAGYLPRHYIKKLEGVYSGICR